MKWAAKICVALQVAMLIMLLPTASSFAFESWSASGHPRRSIYQIEAGHLMACSNQRNDNLDRDFEDLIRDIGISRNSRTTEDSVSKTKDWVDRSFRFFTELNQDAVTLSKAEKVFNEELLRKQQKWANRLIDLAAEIGQDVQESFHERENESSDVGVPGTTPHTADENSGDDGSSVQIPFRVLDNPDDSSGLFQIQLEVPGVELQDIEIELVDDDSSDKARLFVKALFMDGQKIAVQAIDLKDNVDKEQLWAELSDGILTVSAPKKKRTERVSIIRKK